MIEGRSVGVGELAWYIVMAHPGRVRVAVDQLRERVKLPEVYCPVQNEVEVDGRGRLVERGRYTFGHYLFAFGELSSPLVWQEVMQSVGVFRILGNAAPLPLLGVVVERLKAAENGRGELKAVEAAAALEELREKFVPGSRWRVGVGAFTSFEGYVDDKPFDENDCVRLVLSLFGRATPIAVDSSHLEDPTAKRYDRAARGKGLYAPRRRGV